MLFRTMVKKYTAGLILQTKLKKINRMKEKFAQNTEVPVWLMDFLLQTQDNFNGFFLFDILNFMKAFTGIGLLKLFPLIFSWQIRNSNVFLRMRFWMCFRECVLVKIYQFSV